MNALLSNGRVVAINVYVDGDVITDGGCVYAWATAADIAVVPDHAVPGDYVSNGQIVAPPPPVPASVTPRQFKRALLSLDLLDDVDAMIAASGDRLLQIDWGEALSFDRTNPFITQMATALGKTEAEVDALFVLAATL